MTRWRCAALRAGEAERDGLLRPSAELTAAADAVELVAQDPSGLSARISAAVAVWGRKWTSQLRSTR